jgi:hypothetical protein
MCCCSPVGYPYIACVWSDSGYSREAALQLFTLMYTLGVVVAPFVIDLLLVELPHNVDDQTCHVALVMPALTNNFNASTSAIDSSEDNSDNNIMQTMTPQQVTQHTPIVTLYNNNASSNITSEAYLLAKWAFAVGSGGVTIAVLMLVVVCLMFHQTPTPLKANAN